MLNCQLSDSTKRLIRYLMRTYRIRKAEVPGFLYEASTVAKDDTEEAFVASLKKECRHHSNKSSGSTEIFNDTFDVKTASTALKLDAIDEIWHKSEIPADLPRQVLRLLEVAQNGASTQEMAEKLGISQKGVQLLLARQTAKLGGHSHEKKALPRADFKPLSREEKLKAEVHPCVVWTAEQIAELNAEVACHA